MRAIKSPCSGGTQRSQRAHAPQGCLILPSHFLQSCCVCTVELYGFISTHLLCTVYRVYESQCFLGHVPCPPQRPYVAFCLSLSFSPSSLSHRRVSPAVTELGNTGNSGKTGSTGICILYIRVLR